MVQSNDYPQDNMSISAQMVQSNDYPQDYEICLYQLWKHAFLELCLE